ncbi:MAG: hypothetical protein ACRDQ7_21850 [Haloechinothrix sp.]
MTVREIPLGSGINGRPVLVDNLKHVTYRRAGRWHTWCGQLVPEDHMCPVPEPNKGPIKNCYVCHEKYLDDR